MPNRASILKTLDKVHTILANGYVGLFGFARIINGIPSGVYSGFTSTLGERQVVAMMGTGAEYEFSVVVPFTYLQHGVFGDVVDTWEPKVDDVIAGSGVYYRIIGVTSIQTETKLHLGKYLQ